MKIEPRYYRFTQTELIEKKYGLTRHDLIYLAEEGGLPFYLIPGDLFGRWFDQGTGRFLAGENMMNCGPQLLLDYQAKEVIRGKAISFFHRDTNAPGNTPWNPKYGEFWIHHFEFAPCIFPLSSLVIMAENLEALKQETQTPDNTNDSLYGEDEIKAFLGRKSWNTCKIYMEEEGINGPPEGERKWRLPMEIARKIKEKHPPIKKM